MLTCSKKYKIVQQEKIKYRKKVKLRPSIDSRKNKTSFQNKLRMFNYYPLPKLIYIANILILLATRLKLSDTNNI